MNEMKTPVDPYYFLLSTDHEASNHYFRFLRISTNRDLPHQYSKWMVKARFINVIFTPPSVTMISLWTV